MAIIDELREEDYLLKLKIEDARLKKLLVSSQVSTSTPDYSIPLPEESDIYGPEPAPGYMEQFPALTEAPLPPRDPTEQPMTFSGPEAPIDDTRAPISPYDFQEADILETERIEKRKGAIQRRNKLMGRTGGEPSDPENHTLGIAVDNSGLSPRAFAEKVTGEKLPEESAAKALYTDVTEYVGRSAGQSLGGQTELETLGLQAKRYINEIESKRQVQREPVTPEINFPEPAAEPDISGIGPEALSDEEIRDVVKYKIGEGIKALKELPITKIKNELTVGLGEDVPAMLLVGGLIGGVKNAALAGKTVQQARKFAKMQKAVEAIKAMPIEKQKAFFKVLSQEYGTQLDAGILDFYTTSKAAKTVIAISKFPQTYPNLAKAANILAEVGIVISPEILREEELPDLESLAEAGGMVGAFRVMSKIFGKARFADKFKRKAEPAAEPAMKDFVEGAPRISEPTKGLRPGSSPKSLTAPKPKYPGQPKTFTPPEKSLVPKEPVPPKLKDASPPAEGEHPQMSPAEEAEYIQAMEAQEAEQAAQDYQDWEDRLTGYGPNRGIIQKMANYVKMNGSKRSKGSNLLISEHIPRSVFGESSDEVAINIGMDESEFMEFLSEIPKKPPNIVKEGAAKYPKKSREQEYLDTMKKQEDMFQQEGGLTKSQRALKSIERQRAEKKKLSDKGTEDLPLFGGVEDAEQQTLFEPRADYPVEEKTAQEKLEELRRKTGLKKPAPTFYSKLKQVIDEKVPKRIYADQLTQIFKKNGVKQSELESVGMGSFPHGDELITKEKLLSELKKHQIKINVIKKKDRDVLDSDSDYDLQDEYDYLVELGREQGYLSEEDSIRLDTLEAEIQAGLNKKGKPQYKEYSKAGGKEYRETLLTKQNRLTSIEEDAQTVYGKSWMSLTPSQRANLNSAVKKKHYQSPHWEEKDVLAQGRATIHETPTGEKVYVSNEMQSDWSQTGRKMGYMSDKPTKESQLAVLDNNFHMWVVRNEYENHRNIDVLQEWLEDKLRYSPPSADAGWIKSDLEVVKEFQAKRKAIEKGDILEDLIDEFGELGKVPDMPFKKSFEGKGGGWAGLVYKQQLREAVEQKAKFFAWESGRAQIDRYPALSDLVDDIVWTTQVTTDNRIVSLHRKEEATRKFAVNDKGVVVDVIKGGNEDRFNKEHLSSIIGKEVTEKILGDRSGKLEGLELDIGGSGMLKFYDEMLPQAMNKYINQWGVKVEQIPVTLEVVRSRDYPSGALFTYEGPELTSDALRKLSEDKSYKDKPYVGWFPTQPRLLAGLARHMDNSGQSMATSITDIYTRSMAAELADLLGGKIVPKTTTENLMGFKITDQMADDVLYKGQPLFEKKPSYAPGKDRIILSGVSVPKEFPKLLKKYVGTNWAKAAKQNLVYRKAIDGLITGKISESDKIPGQMGLYLKRGEPGAWDYLNTMGAIGAPAKPRNAVNSSLINCDPSSDCANFCYATKGNYGYGTSQRKSELIDYMVTLNPQKMGKLIARQYKANPAYEAEKALRLFDKGDITPEWVEAIKEINKQGVRVHVFSKKPKLLNKISSDNVRLLSVDKSNMDIAEGNNLPISFIYTGTEDLPLLEKLQDRVQVILPVKLGSRLLKQSELNLMPEWAQKKSCPIDAGIKKLSPVGDNTGWNCLKCDNKANGVGCYKNQPTTNKHFNVVAPKPGDIKNIINGLKELLKNEKRNLTPEEFGYISTELQGLSEGVSKFKPGTEVKEPTGKYQTTNSLQQELDFGDIPPVSLKKQPVELQRAHAKTVKLLDKMVQQRKDLSKTQIFKSLMSTGFADLNGVSVKNINEFVSAIQVWRNPNFETFRIVYLKDDVVVGYNSFSSRMPGAALSGPKNAREALNFRAKIKWEMEKRGANGYGLVHNHQSGVVQPSLADRQVTALYDSRLPGFKWHIVINHNKYSIIDRNLESNIYRIKGDVKDPYERKTRVQITSPETMAEYAKSINTPENNIGLIFVSAEMKINGATSIHKNIWKSKPDEFSNAVKNQAKIYGTANVVAVIPANMSESEMGKLANTGIFLDIIYDNASVVRLQREVHPNWNMPSNNDWMKLKWNQVTEPRPEYGPQLPTGKARETLDKFMEGSVVKDDGGNPLVVYHGTGSTKNFTEFKPEMTGQGNDQIGSGFYFSTNPETASAYTVSQIEKGVIKLGGEDSPGILPVYLNIKNPIVVKEGNLVNTDVNLTKNQVYKILKKSSKIMDKEESPLGDWYEEYWDVGPKDWMIRKVADDYRGSNLLSLEKDFFKDNSTGFRKALSEATGYDGVKMELNNETHYVAWFPNQIKSATGNKGTFDAASSNILEEEKPSYSSIPEPEKMPAPETPKKALELLRHTVGFIKGAKSMTPKAALPIYDRWVREVQVRTFELSKFLNDLERMGSQVELEAVPFFVEGTDVPEKLIWDRDIQAALDNPESRKRIERMAEAWEIHRDKIWEYMENNRKDMTVDQIENYVTHLWDLKDKKSVDRAVKWFTTRNPQLNKRIIPTLFEGIEEVGLQPKVLSIRDIAAIHGQNAIRTTENEVLLEGLKALQDENGIKLIQRFDLAPPGWKSIDHPMLDRAMYIPGKEKMPDDPEDAILARQEAEEDGEDAPKPKSGPGMLTKVPVKFHPDLAPLMQAVFSSPWNPTGKTALIVTAWEGANALLKQSQLGISFFHHIALAEAAIATMGPLKTGQIAFNVAAIHRALNKKEFAMFAEKYEIARDGVEHGLMLGANPDVQKAQVDKILEWTGDFLEDKTKAGLALSKAFRFAGWSKEKWDMALWDYYHNNLKLYAYETLVARGMKKITKKLGEKSTLTLKDLDHVRKMKEEMASMVNDTFGGQNLLKQMKDPQFMRVFRAAFLSPDWLVSTLKQAGSVATIGTIHPEFKAERAKMGIKFWARAALWVGGFSMAVNYLMSKQDDAEQKDIPFLEGEGKWMWENDPGHQTHLFWGRDAEGKKIYIRHGKQFRELPEFFYDAYAGEWSPITATMKKLGGKMAPVPQLLSSITTGKTLSGFGIKELDKVEGWEKVAGIAKVLGTAWVPFSFSALRDEKKKWSPMQFAFPTSTGMTNFKTRKLMKTALVKNDIDFLEKVWDAALENNIGEVNKIFDQAVAELATDANEEFKSKLRYNGITEEELDAIDSPEKLKIAGAQVRLLKKMQSSVEKLRENKWIMQKKIEGYSKKKAAMEGELSEKQKLQKEKLKKAMGY